MSDVAERAGVSRALVSLVFRDMPGASEETRARVFAIAKEIGYRPHHAARMLASNRSRVLGVMLTIRNPFHADLVEALYAEAERRGYEIVLSGTAPNRDEEGAVEALLGHHCEALILLGPKTSAGYLAGIAEQLPVTLVGRSVDAPRVDSVYSAESHGIRQAVDHLVEHGHRDIVHLDGGSLSGSADRREAYQVEMRRHGLAERARVVPGRHTEESGGEAATALLAEGTLPTALLASNDRSALGFLDGMLRAGVRVPEDISVVGYDDSHLVNLSYIGLTTVRQDADGMARGAVEAALARIDEPGLAPRQVVLEPELVVRGTSGPPRTEPGGSESGRVPTAHGRAG